MDGVGDNNDFGNVFFAACLTNTASYGKEFHFCAGDKGHVVNRLDQRVVMYVNVRDQCGKVILDASIGYNNCCVR